MALLAILLFLLIGFPTMTLAGDTPSETRMEPATTSAVLSVKSANPLTIAGRGFKPLESVRISSEGRIKRVRASKRGTFTVRLAGQDPCAGGTIVAFGSKGSRASLNFSQLLCVEQ